MSRFYDRADEIAESLATLEILADTRVVVDRQNDIVSELRKVVGKQIGNLVLVTWTGGTNTDETADGPRVESTFSVTLFSKPVIRVGETTADDIVEAMAQHLHDWRPAGSGAYQNRLVVTAITPVPAGELLAYQIRLKTPSQL
jgi:hypothetical protein